MGLIDSDSISAHGDKVLGVRPWVDERSENLNRITISEVRFHASQLKSIKESDSTEYFDDEWYNLFIKWSPLFSSRATSEISNAPRVKSSVGPPLSFSTEIFSDFNNNEDRISDLTNRLWDRIPQNIPLQSSVTRDYVYTGGTDPETQIKNASHHEEIFDVLDFVGHRKIADRLKYLHEITPDDDPEDPPMEFQSLKECALFFLDNDFTIPYPQIGICPSGLLHVEWRSRSRKVSSSMRFLLDGNARFVGTMAVQGNLRQTIQGAGAKNYALQSILPYIKHATIGHA
ncbi:MAG: hypothetical protein OXG88_00025 [Gammaproteobacteria bacterium]|nr:hypothetical protein [Gammaproteobacteria bacterium]